MSNWIALTNDLQRKFSTLARTESGNHYILPWTRGWLRNASSLDPIYRQLGINNFTRQDYRNLRTAMLQAKRTLYRNTLAWLIDDVMNGDYTQLGNSCGAWSTIHWEMRNAERYDTGLQFRTIAINLHLNIQFALADWVGIPVHPIFQGWVLNQYVNPWKILNRLNVPRLQITRAANIFQANNTTPFEQILHGMLTIINHIKPPAKQVVQEGDLTNLRTGGKAIIIAYTTTYELHYMLLVKTETDWNIYNSNSAKLNPTVLAACPQFSGTHANPIVTNLLNRDGTANGTQTHHFIGVFIKL